MYLIALKSSKKKGSIFHELLPLALSEYKQAPALQIVRCVWLLIWELLRVYAINPCSFPQRRSQACHTFLPTKVCSMDRSPTFVGAQTIIASLPICRKLDSDVVPEQAKE